MLTQKGLYAGILVALIVVLLGAMGNGLWNLPLDYTSWNYQMFRGICHQLPERSMSINGVTMAVNARCFGVFSGLTLAWALLPLVIPLLVRFRQEKKLLLFAALLQIIDNTAGRFNIWQSSNTGRFLMGLILGITVVTAIGSLFKNKEKKPGNNGN